MYFLVHICIATSEGMIPVLLGGYHVLALPFLAALRESLGKAGEVVHVVTKDLHSDLIEYDYISNPDKEWRVRVHNANFWRMMLTQRLMRADEFCHLSFQSYSGAIENDADMLRIGLSKNNFLGPFDRLTGRIFDGRPVFYSLDADVYDGGDQKVNLSIANVSMDLGRANIAGVQICEFPFTENSYTVAKSKNRIPWIMKDIAFLMGMRVDQSGQISGVKFRDNGGSFSIPFSSEVYPDTGYVLRKSFSLHRKIMLKRVGDGVDLSRLWENEFLEYGRQAPEKAPRNGFVRLLEGDDLLEAIRPLPPFLLANITYRRAESSIPLFITIFVQDGIFKGEITVTDISKTGLADIISAAQNTGFVAESGLDTTKEQLAFLREVLKLSFVHEAGELFTFANQDIMHIWESIDDIYPYGATRLIVRSGRIVRDLRHEFCDYLMPYFWPDNPVLKRFNLSNDAREAITKILAIAESRPFGGYMLGDSRQTNGFFRDNGGEYSLDKKSVMRRLCEGGPISIPQQYPTKSFPALVDDILADRIALPLIYKLDKSHDGIGIFYIERNKLKEVVITMAYVPAHPAYVDYLSRLSPDKAKIDNIQDIVTVNLGTDPKTIKEFLLQLERGIREETKDSGYVEAVYKDVFQVFRCAYETRYIAEVTLGGMFSFKKVKGYSRIGASSYFANFSGRLCAKLMEEGFPSHLYNEFVPYDKVDIFESNIERLIRLQHEYMLTRLENAGYAFSEEEKAVKFKAEFDLMWQVPSREGDLPKPLLVELRYHFPQAYRDNGGDSIGNPYKFENFINRSFDALDSFYGRSISTQVEGKIRILGRKPRVLMIGIGRGFEAFMLLHRYKDQIDITSVSLEDLCYRDPRDLVARFKEEHIDVS